MKTPAPIVPAYGSITEAATYTSLGESTIQKLIANGTIPVRRVGRRVLIKFSDVDTVLAPSHSSAGAAVAAS